MEKDNSYSENMNDPTLCQCIIVHDNSFIELRDCLIRSVLDDTLLFDTLEDFISKEMQLQPSTTGETDQIKQDFYDFMK
jgi:hypothetical protein